MFIGHYAPAFAAKSAEDSIPLWLLFLAVQFVDLLWSVFVMLGIEKAQIVPGITATNPLDLYYMPYTHSLVAAIGWSVVVGIGIRLVPRFRNWRASLLIGAMVLSHWFLDLLVHRPDLPLYDNTAKVGLGLWNYPVPAFLLEAGLLAGGMWLYFRSTRALSPGGRYGMIVFAVLMLAIQLSVFFGPPPPSEKIAAAMALFSYISFCAVIYWLEKKRVPLRTTIASLH
jgi:membrane-bound metal-dependent hydrolase YbcI (DUF457 family)